MSVLIKDMEMPKNCVECKLSDHISPTECPIYSIEKGDYWDKRYKYCPLVEVPTPHGRLIDADEIVNDCEKYIKSLNPDRDGKEIAKIRWLVGILNEQPTIIEKEGSET